MRQPTEDKTLGQCLAENQKERKDRLEKRLDEVEEWMLDNSFTHKDFQKYVEERNNIITQLNLIRI